MKPKDVMMEQEQSIFQKSIDRGVAPESLALMKINLARPE